MGVGEGYGKLILFGEHSAVYNHPAVGLRLATFLRVATTPVNNDTWIFTGVDVQVHRKLEEAAGLLPEFIRETGPAYRVTITGDLPIGTGFGSSAAFCTALLKALDERNVLSDVCLLWEAAHKMERAFHGTPSGIDTGLSVLSGTNALYPQPSGLPVANQVTLPRCFLVVGAIERSSSTAALVRGIRTARESNPSRVETLLGELGQIARAVISEGRSTPTRLGDHCRCAQNYLQQLQLSTPELDHALDLLEGMGSLGGKLSGAGGGGAFFGVFDDEQQAGQAAAELRSWIAQMGLYSAGEPYVEIIKTA